MNETLFPVGKRVRLSSGEYVEVRPWSIKMFGEMSQRIPNVWEKAIDQPDESLLASAVFDTLIDEVLFMVSRTIGWTEEEIHARMTADDLLTVTSVVWDECIQGPAGKIAGLLGKVMGTIGAPAVLIPNRPVSSSPSSSSSQTDTPGEKSKS